MSAEFAPTDPDDGRSAYEWESKWSKQARSAIRWEATLIIALIVLSPLGMLALVAVRLESALDLTPAEAEAARVFGIAWLSGTLGGSVFSAKWLYHSVARGKWHLDRRYWRFITPLNSGALAFAIATLIRGDFVPLVDPDAIRPLSAAAGVSFLVGYFSDNAIAALAKAATNVFGEHTGR